MKRLYKKIPMLILTLCLIINITPVVYASNGGLIGANIKDGKLLGYFGDGGDIVIPHTVTMIGEKAFEKNDNVTSVTIPGSVSMIGFNAFDGCTALEQIIFSDPVDGAQMTIRINAFINCPKLYECELPATATYVTGNVFKGCTSLEKITVHPENPHYFTDDNGVLFGPWVDEGEPQYDDPNLTLNAYPCGRAAGGYTIPTEVNGRTVNRVWSSAFRMAKNLTDISIPSTVTILGANAFEETGLSQVTIPVTVTNLGAYMFAGCTELTDITLPEGMTTLPAGFFMGCTSLSRINFPDTLKTLEMYSLRDCTSLTNLVLPQRLSAIALAAFQGCTNLQRVVIPSSVTLFPSDAYVGAYDPFEDSPRSLMLYVQKGSTAERWAVSNVSNWGYSYEVLDDVSDLESISTSDFYMINTEKKVKVEGEFPIYASLKVDTVVSGQEYDQFKTQAENGLMSVYRVSLLPDSISAPDQMDVGFGLGESFTKNSKLYTLQGNTVSDLNADMISKTLTAKVDALGYFAVMDTANQPSSENDEVTSVTLNKTNGVLEVGGQIQLSATVLPANAKDKTVTWSSSNSSVATVNNRGVVTAVSAGNTSISATTTNGKIATCSITVNGSGGETPADKIETDAGFYADKAAAENGYAAFSLKLSKASRIASIQITFETSTDHVSISGKNGFSVIGDIKGNLSSQGVYTGTAVLGYLTSDKSLFSCSKATDVVSILVKAQEPTVKITDIKISGWDASETVAYGIVKAFSPREATFTGDISYDVNGDGTVDLMDITTAQLYYRATLTDSNWAAAGKCDFNGDNVIDIQDYIMLWINFTSN